MRFEIKYNLIGSFVVLALFVFFPTNNMYLAGFGGMVIGFMLTSAVFYSVKFKAEEEQTIVCKVQGGLNEKNKP